jgi:ABC-2 type transport system permease protein
VVGKDISGKQLTEHMNRLFGKIKKYQFMFEELVNRDFKEKYKRSILGMGWSVLSPLLTLLVMKVIFSTFFGKDIPHYTIYLFSGNIVLSYYRESTRNGMNSLVDNAGIFTKINVPKYMFVLSKNVSALVNFALTLAVYFVFCAFDGIRFNFRMLLLVYPIACLLLMNIGIGMVLSALYVFFRDIRYLYDVLLTLVNYMSAVFYTVDKFPAQYRRLFLLNPVYVYIKYFRVIVIEHKIPSLAYHGLCALYAMLFLALGMVIYKKYNHQFLYYL